MNNYSSYMNIYIPQANYLLYEKYQNYYSYLKNKGFLTPKPNKS